jgi:uncharacterized protein (TIGR03435 family)
MKADRTDFDKTLRRHMSLFGAPSANQLEASRARIHERLRDNDEPAVSEEIEAPRHRHPWRTRLLLATAAAALVIVIAPWPRAYALKSTPIMRILAFFTKGMIDTSAPLQPVDAPAAAPSSAAGQTPGRETPQPSTATSADRDFDEASIKPCDPDNLPPQPDRARGGGPNSFQLTPGRLRALCITPATLVRTAYGLSPLDLDFAEGGRSLPMDFGNVYGLGQEDGNRVRNAPEWARSERYTIEAVAGTGRSPDAQTLRGPMLQRLLERRFQLQAHIESEQTPAFALAVAKGGLKIKPVKADGCDELPGRAGAPLFYGHPGSVLTPPRNFADVRKGQKPSCGLWTFRDGPNMIFVGGDIPLEALMDSLAFRLGGVRMVNRTNVNDRFNFILEFVLDENTPGPLQARRINMPPQPGESNDVPPAATIFSAIEEQLGLKLERAQVGREFIVIDRIERPSPN